MTREDELGWLDDQAQDLVRTSRMTVEDYQGDVRFWAECLVDLWETRIRSRKELPGWYGQAERRYMLAAVVGRGEGEKSTTPR